MSQSRHLPSPREAGVVDRMVLVIRTPPGLPKQILQRQEYGQKPASLQQLQSFETIWTAGKSNAILSAACTCFQEPPVETEPEERFMSRLSLPISSAMMLGFCGCVTDNPKTETVAGNPFGQALAIPPATRGAYAPAKLDAAARVDQIGRRLVAANKEAGLQPLFRTIGAPQAEIFHRGATEHVTPEIDITEGLVKQCASDGQLAAALCYELGKMVSEREALTAPHTRVTDRLQPLDAPAGNNGGGFGPADQLHRAELAKFDQEHPRKPLAVAPPDPQTLAQSYLTKAGYPESDLDAVAPILRAAAENNTLARQLMSPLQVPR